MPIKIVYANTIFIRFSLAIIPSGQFRLQLMRHNKKKEKAKANKPSDTSQRSIVMWALGMTAKLFTTFAIRFGTDSHAYDFLFLSFFVYSPFLFRFHLYYPFQPFVPTRQSSTICWIDCGACKCSNYFGDIIWALLCDLWTVKSWLRLHKNPSADDMSGCMGGCCNFYKVINSSYSYPTKKTK